MSRSLTQTIGMLRYGKLADEADEQLAQLVAACEATGRAGSITLTIALRPGKGGQVEIADDLKLKLPKPDKQTSILFISDDAGLQREDPRQRTLPLTAVEMRQAPADLRDPLAARPGASDLRDPLAAGTPAGALAGALKTA